MNCRSVVDRVYENLGDKPLPLVVRMEIAVHLLFCPRCADEIARLEGAMTLLQNGCFPPAPGLGALILRRLSLEISGPAAEAPEEEAEYPGWMDDTAAGFPLRGWVITGCIILVSLATSFFGMDFADIAASQGMSFLLPVGITIGAVVSGYGALFIGSHLKELSDRFNLH
jgi:hypothetical protein